MGLAAASADIPLHLALVAYYQAVIGNLISCALRLIPLGQTAGQRILARLEPAIIAAAYEAIDRDPADIGTAAPLIEWNSMRHETQYTRLFRT